MTYLELLQGVPFSGEVSQGEAALVTQDSRRLVEGAVFVCIEGRGFDGHDFAAAALAAGAGLVVTQRPLGLACEVTVADTRAAYAAMCANFFGRPAEKLRLVGVTGTNGKTTVTSILRQVLEALGLRCGLIGTIQSEIGELEIPAKFTTPEPWDLNALFSRMVAAGCTHVVMEASSQALEQGRLLGLRFALGVFTNLSRDHLDYHGDMESYFAAKKLLFAQSDAALVNMDDAYGRQLLKQLGGARAYGFSAEDTSAAFQARDVSLRAGGVKFALLGDGFLLPVRFPMPGEYSVSNALAAAGAAILLGEQPADVSVALGKVRGVRGRCEVIYNGEFTVLCDFAHTADGMEKLLCALRPFAKSRMVVLFGCAGKRDASKRPAMGEAAARYGDSIVLSSDNPRDEDVAAIMADVVSVLKKSGKPYIVEPDRALAIGRALESLQEGDMLVLCGKGHEEYQVMDGYTVYMDERQIVREWLERKEDLR